MVTKCRALCVFGVAFLATVSGATLRAWDRFPSAQMYPGDNIYSGTYVESDVHENRLRLDGGGLALSADENCSAPLSNCTWWNSYIDANQHRGYGYHTNQSTSAPGYWAVMQGDGNFVLYASDTNITARWATNTYGHSGAYLSVQNDGNMVVYIGTSPLWSLF